MTDKLRAAAQQALEALESLFSGQVDHERAKRCSNAITALRTALAEQPAEQSAKHGEPVRTEFTRVINHAIEQGTEAWVFLRCWQEGDWSGCAEFGFEPNMAAYTAPQPAKRVPLTRDRVKAMLVDAGYEGAAAQHRADFINGLRHGERAHGINVPQARGEQE